MCVLTQNRACHYVFVLCVTSFGTVLTLIWQWRRSHGCNSNFLPPLCQHCHSLYAVHFPGHYTSKYPFWKVYWKIAVVWRLYQIKRRAHWFCGTWCITRLSYLTPKGQIHWDLCKCEDSPVAVTSSERMENCHYILHKDVLSFILSFFNYSWNYSQVFFLHETYLVIVPRSVSTRLFA